MCGGGLVEARYDEGCLRGGVVGRRRCVWRGLFGAGCEERGVSGGGLVGRLCVEGQRKSRFGEKGSKSGPGYRSSLRLLPSLFQQSEEPLGWCQVLKEASNGMVQGALWKE